MATRTTYYNLIKPSQTDPVDVRDLNTNFDNIDAIMHTNETNIDALDGRITTAESDIEDLQESTEHLSDGDTVYPYASEIEIEDALGVNAKDVNVKITAQHDLHGYDHPWAGGAGKNKLPMTVASIKAANTGGTWSGNVYALNGVTFTVQTDADGNVTGIKVNGTASAQTVLTFTNELDDILTASTAYYLNGCSGGSNETYELRLYNPSTYGAFWNYSGDTSFTYSDGIKNAEIFIRANTAFPSAGQMFYPMIRLYSIADSTFEPYSNNCPISGWDECEVDRVGKNLFGFGDNTVDKTTEYRINPTQRLIITDSNTNELSFRYNGKWSEAFLELQGIDGSKDYAISYEVTNNNTSYSPILAKDNSLSDSNKLILCVNGANGSTSVTSDYHFTLTNIMVSSTATHYEPYQGKTYTIDLGDTIYGGTIDVTTGVMTVTHGKKNGSELEFTKVDDGIFRSAIMDRKFGANLFPIISSEYGTYTGANSTTSNIASLVSENGNNVYINGGSNVFYVADSRYTGLTAFETSVADVDFCYELATPITIQLTPQQIQLLEGYNYISANTGDISITTTDIKGAIGQADELIEANTQAIREIDSLNDSIFGTVENGTTASQAYAQGDYFVKDKKMCKALTSIAQGATFTLDTNYAAHTLADILKAIEQS